MKLRQIHRLHFSAYHEFGRELHPKVYCRLTSQAPSHSQKTVTEFEIYLGRGTYRFRKSFVSGRGYYRGYFSIVEQITLDPQRASSFPLVALPAGMLHVDLSFGRPTFFSLGNTA